MDFTQTENPITLGVEGTVQNEEVGVHDATVSPFVGDSGIVTKNLSVGEEQEIAETYGSKQIDFDIKGAREARYSDDEILSHMASTYSDKFDFDKAKEHYSATEILEYIDKGIGHEDVPEYVKKDGSFNEDLRTVVKNDNKIAEDIMLQEMAKTKGGLTHAEQANIIKKVRGDKQYNPHDFDLGIKSFILGLERTATEVGEHHPADWVFRLIVDDELLEESDARYKEDIDNIKEKIKDIGVARKDNDFFSMYTAGELTAQIATLPVAVQGRLAIFATEASLGAVAEAGQVGSDGEASTAGDIATASAISGVAGVAAGEVGKYIADRITGKAGQRVQEDVKDYWLTKLNLQHKEAEIFEAYQKKVVGVEDTPANRMLAVLDYAGNEGKEIKRVLMQSDEKVGDAIRRNVTDNYNQLHANISAKSANPLDMYKETVAGFRRVKDDYKIVKQSMPVKAIPNSRMGELPQAFDEIKSDHAVVQELLGRTVDTDPNKIITESDIVTTSNGEVVDRASRYKQTIKDATGSTTAQRNLLYPQGDLDAQPIQTDITTTVGQAPREPLGYTTRDIIDAMPHINEIIRKSKGGNAKKWSELKTTLESQLEEAIDPNMFKAWKEANAQYSTYMRLNSNNFEKHYKEWVKGNISGKELLQKSLVKSNNQTQTDVFKDLHQLLGEKGSRDFENMFATEALGKHYNDFTFSQFAEYLSKGTMQSQEGKALQKYAKELADVLRTDNKLANVLFGDEGSELGRGMHSDIINKAAAFLINKVWRGLTKYTKGTDAYYQRHLMTAIKDNPRVLEDIKAKITKDGDAGIRREAIKAIREMDMLSTGSTSSRIGADILEEVKVDNGKVHVKDNNAPITTYSTKPPKTPNPVNNNKRWLDSATIKYTDSYDPSSYLDSAIADGMSTKVASGIYDTVYSSGWMDKVGELRKGVLNGTLTEGKAMQELAVELHNRMSALNIYAPKAQYKEVADNYYQNIKKVPATVTFSNGKPSFTMDDNDSLVKNIVGHESGGDYTAKNPKSSAYGKYQFIDSRRREIASKIGLTEEGSKTPEGQELMMQYAMNEYKALLTKWGQPIDKANTYTIHQMGAGRARRYFSGKLNSNDIKVLKDNIPKKFHASLKTRKDVLKKWEELYRS